MKTYWVEVTTEIPYPVIREYRVKASGIGTVLNRAWKLYRQDPKVKRKRLHGARIKVSSL